MRGAQRAHQGRRAALGLAFAVALASHFAACASRPDEVPSVWPPSDFRLVVEELQQRGDETLVVRRFRVEHDGLCIFGVADDEPLGDPRSGIAVPVFRTLCAYRLLPETTRMLARRLYTRGILGLSPEQGDGRDTKGVALRVYYRVFGNEKVVVARGQIHGAMSAIVDSVNCFLPAAQRFELVALTGSREPSRVTGVPTPVIDAAAALEGHAELLRLLPDDADLLLDAFALACRTGDGATARALLERWTAAIGVRAAPAAPFVDPPLLSRQMLEPLLPPH